MALPGAPRHAVQLITRKGGKFLAHMPGQKEGVDLTHPEVHVHLRPGVHFDPGDGSPPVDIHDAFHNNPKALPPALMALIVAAVERYFAQLKMHESAAAPMPPVGRAAPRAPLLPGAALIAPAPPPSGAGLPPPVGHGAPGGGPPLRLPGAGLAAAPLGR